MAGYAIKGKAVGVHECWKGSLEVLAYRQETYKKAKGNILHNFPKTYCFLVFKYMK